MQLIGIFNRIKKTEFTGILASQFFLKSVVTLTDSMERSMEMFCNTSKLFNFTGTIVNIHFMSIEAGLTLEGSLATGSGANALHSEEKNYKSL